ncbi:ATPase, partial [Streptomyces varsoviensis]
MGLTDAQSPRTLQPGATLAIDAGNSKTDVALIAADGRVLGTARGGGFQPPTIGAERAVAGLAPLVAHATGQARAGEAGSGD